MWPGLQEKPWLEPVQKIIEPAQRYPEIVACTSVPLAPQVVAWDALATALEAGPTNGQQAESSKQKARPGKQTNSCIAPWHHHSSNNLGKFWVSNYAAAGLAWTGWTAAAWKTEDKLATRSTGTGRRQNLALQVSPNEWDEQGGAVCVR